MQPVLRILMAVLVLVFAAGTVVQATAATQMKHAAPIAMSMTAGEHMLGCADCSGDPEAAVGCIAACALPAASLAASTALLFPAAKAPVRSISSRVIVGLAQAPDPYPPRLSILI